MPSGKGRTPAMRDLGDKRIEMLHAQRKRADISGKGRTPDGQRKRTRTRPEALSLGDNEKKWETIEKKWETNERKWETSQPGTRPQAWETNGDKPTANPTTNEGSGRQASREPDHKHPAWETNEKNWETNDNYTSVDPKQFFAFIVR